ncbi:MAG: DNA repair protein RecO [Clostridia bacterium]|nr:DNA repair protein RecO [Clostridia bacterium]
MPEELKTKAIVVRAVPYHETDMIITLVSPEYGKLTATARGCLKPKAKLRYAAEPMNFGDYLLNGKGERYIIVDCSQIESFSSVTYDIEKFYAASLVLEVLAKLTPDEPEPALFLDALSALNDLTYSKKDTDEVVTDFLLAVLKDNGSDLDFSHCNVCKCDLTGDAYFDVADGIVCEHCKNFGATVIDGVSRAYIGGENRDIPHELKARANMLVAEILYSLLGTRIGSHYFAEQL